MNWKRIILTSMISLGLLAIPALAQDATTTGGTQDTGHNDTNAKTKKAMKKAANKTQDMASDTKDAVTGNKRIDVNSATVEELSTLPGVDAATAQKIVDNRPYTGKNDLVKKDVVSADEYAKIKDQVVAKKTTSGKHKTKKSGAAATTAGPSM